MKSKDPAKRKLAVAKLALESAEAALPPLLGALQDSAPEVRRAAALAPR